MAPEGPEINGGVKVIGGTWWCFGPSQMPRKETCPSSEADLQQVCDQSQICTSVRCTPVGATRTAGPYVRTSGLRMYARVRYQSI